MRARYYRGAEGRGYFYESDATWQCPYGTDGPAVEKLVRHWRGVPDEPDLERLIRRAHRRGVRLADPGDETRCDACGAKLEKHGYRTWIELPIDQADADEATRQLNSLLGTTHLVKQGSVRFWPTKREAIQWAREEAQIDRETTVAA